MTKYRVKRKTCFESLFIWIIMEMNAENQQPYYHLFIITLSVHYAG